MLVFEEVNGVLIVIGYVIFVGPDEGLTEKGEVVLTNFGYDWYKLR